MHKLIMMTLASLMMSTPATATDFSFQDTRGETQSLSQYRGHWVLLNLWATWCTPCLAEMPELEALSKSRDDLVVLGLAIDGDDSRRVIQFAKKLHITYPVIAGSVESAKQFGARGFPTSLLFDVSGTRIFTKEGVITRAEIENILGKGSH